MMKLWITNPRQAADNNCNSRRQMQTDSESLKYIKSGCNSVKGELALSESEAGLNKTNHRNCTDSLTSKWD